MYIYIFCTIICNFAIYTTHLCTKGVYPNTQYTPVYQGSVSQQHTLHLCTKRVYPNTHYTPVYPNTHTTPVYLNTQHTHHTC